jgi:hypothetical protein
MQNVTYVPFFLLFTCKCLHRGTKILKYFLHHKRPYPLHEELLDVLPLLESLVTSINY